LSGLLKKSFMKKPILLLSVCLFCLSSFSQNLEWAKKIGGKMSESNISTAVDRSGNVYTAGFFEDTVDFDPGPGTFEMVATGNVCAYAYKLDSAGNFLWAKSWGNHVLATRAFSVAVDDSGNVFIGGTFPLTVDFDPGPGTSYLTSLGSMDAYFLKLNTSGDFVCVRAFSSKGQDGIYYALVDRNQDLIINVGSADTMDVDPGPGVFKVNPANLFIVKLDNSCNFIRVVEPRLNGNVAATCVSVDSSGNLYLIGRFQGTVDFNPGPAVYNLVSAGYDDTYVLLLDSMGTFKWAKRLGNSNTAFGSSLVSDFAGNTFVAGIYTDTMDFDPGTGVYNLIAPAGSRSLFMLKLNSSGDFVWARSIGKPGVMLELRGLALDNSGNVVFGGTYKDPIDFDPGAGSYILTPTGNYDIFIAKLDSSGNFRMAAGIGGTGNAQAVNGGIVVKDEHAFLSGQFSYTVDFDAGPGTYNLTSDTTLVFRYDNFITKMSVCDIPGQDMISGPASICDPTSHSYSVYALSGATGYNWSVPAGAVITSGQNTPSIRVTFGSTAGFVKLSITNKCGHSYHDSLPVTLNQPPAVGYVAAPSAMLCAGETLTLTGNGATNYSWTNPVTNGVSFVPPGSGSYIVTGTDSNGCTAIDTAEIIVYTLPAVSINVTPSSTVCSGDSIILTGMGPFNFSWTPSVTNGIAFVPPGSGSYILTATDSNGCKATDTAEITVNTLPMVSINVTPSSTICRGDSVILTGIGPFNFSWTPSVTNGVAFAPLQTALYTLTATDTNGCTDTANVTFTVHALPAVSATVDPPAAVCAGASVILTGTGASGYSWNNNVINATPFVPASTNSYTVTGTDTNGCSDTASVTVIVQPQPQFTLQPSDQTAMQGGAVLFNVDMQNAPAILQWQEDPGMGFTDLANGGQYAGVDSDSLMISNVTASQNNFRYRCIATAGNCSDTSATAILFIGNVGFEKVKAESRFAFYPNPATDLLNIHFESSINEKIAVHTFSITDATGRELLSGKLENTVTAIDISSLAAGIYFIRLGEMKLPVKFIKK
jgi:hypothetical protein